MRCHQWLEPGQHGFGSATELVYRLYRMIRNIDSSRAKIDRPRTNGQAGTLQDSTLRRCVQRRIIVVKPCMHRTCRYRTGMLAMSSSAQPDPVGSSVAG